MTKKKATSKITFQGIGQPSKTGGYTPPAPVPGCTDPNATNYDPLANVDDGTCIPILYGCTDPDALNYNPNANTDNGLCIPRIYGCTNPAYYEYNPLANTDDGSCSTLLVYGCTNPNASNYDSTANTDDGSCVFAGCTDPNAFNYDSNATVDDGSCTYYACGDPNALNHNPSASPTGPVYFTDNSLCSYGPTSGCMDPAYLEYDPLATVDTTPTSCITPVVNGCTDPLAFNYNSNANVDDGSCILSYDPSFIPTTTLTTDIIIAGGVGVNPSYFLVQMVDSGGAVSPTTVTINLSQAGTGWVWNSPLTIYSGSRNFSTDPNNLTGGDIPFTDINGVDLGSGVVSGTITFQFTNSSGNVIHTQTETLTSLDLIMGCGDSSALNYDSTINFNLLSSCIAIVYGCTNPNAINYYPGANTDDGSCQIPGCTDPTALNYNSTATFDDGSCTYPAPVGSHENITAGFINHFFNTSLLFTRPDGTTYATDGHQEFYIDRTSLVSAYVQVPNTQDEPYNYVFEYAIGCGGLNSFIDASTGTLVSGVTWGDENAAGITTNDGGNNFYYNGSQYGIPQGSQSVIHTRLNQTTANGGLQSPVGDYFTDPSTTPYYHNFAPHPSWNPNMQNGTYPVYGPGYFGTPNPPNKILVATTLASSTDHPNNPNSDPVYYAFKLTTFNNSGDISVDSFVIEISIGVGTFNTPGTVNYTTINIPN